MDCAYHSHRIYELEKHVCSRIQKFHQGKSHGKFVVSLYECTKCSYRTVKSNDAKQHIYLHRLKTTKKKVFYYCSFCGYNHQYRTKIILHIAKYHSKMNTSNCLIPCHYEFDADFSIRQAILKRSFLEKQLKKPRIFRCNSCPYISASIVEHDQHRSGHQENSLNVYKCQYCSFASKSRLYTNQHMLLHSNPARLSSSDNDIKNLQSIPISTIYKEILGKSGRYNCPFCKRFASSYSSTILKHIKLTHAGNNHQFHGSLIIGSDLAKEILFL
jgi:transcription elongation factor Elf1